MAQITIRASYPNDRLEDAVNEFFHVLDSFPPDSVEFEKDRNLKSKGTFVIRKPKQREAKTSPNAVSETRHMKDLKRSIEYSKSLLNRALDVYYR